MTGSDHNTSLVICISPGLHGKWDVSKKGFEEPLASFDAKEDAYTYATELSRSTKEATVLVEDEEGFSPLPRTGNNRRREDSTGDAPPAMNH